MSWIETKAAIAQRLEATAPAIDPSRPFKELRDVENDRIPATSGQFRRFAILVGAGRPGTLISGTGLKQVVRDLVIATTYPKGKGWQALINTVIADMDAMLASLNSQGWYDFDNTGLQLIKATADLQPQITDSLILTNLQVTAVYLGSA